MKDLSALEKYRIILPILEHEVPATSVAKDLELSVRTVRSWIKNFKSKGLSGLEHKARKDRGVIKIEPALFEMAKSLALQKPPLTCKSIYRRLIQIADTKSLKPPSYSTIYKAIKSINPALLTLAHQGGKAYQQRYELIYRRECAEPNEVWQADHTELDIHLVDGKGNWRRPWLTTIIDDFSRAICGYYLSYDSPSSVNTALALRQAIWKKDNPDWQVCGVPKTIYTDHGADFMSAHIEEVCIKLKIRRINSLVGRPQGRGKVERFFETLNSEVLSSMPGFIIEGKPASEPQADLTELQLVIEKFIIENYNVRVHKTTGLPPNIKWSVNGFIPQSPNSIDELDLLLLAIEKPRKVQRDGIQFQGLRYISPTLAGFVGEAVVIKYDPRDLAQIRVYHQEQFLCKAVCQDIAELVVSLKEIQKARSKVKIGLYQEIKKAKALIKELKNQKGIVTKSKQSEPIEYEKHKLKRYESD